MNRYAERSAALRGSAKRQRAELLIGEARKRIGAQSDGFAAAI